MKILIKGNLGNVGSGIVNEFRTHCPRAEIVGIERGYSA